VPFLELCGDGASDLFQNFADWGLWDSLIVIHAVSLSVWASIPFGRNAA
jgi:hypothetical protein